MTLQLPAASNISPSAWVIIGRTKMGQTSFHVLCGFFETYLEGDSWRLSSAIRDMIIGDDKETFFVRTDGGSTYRLPYDSIGFTSSTIRVLDAIRGKTGDEYSLSVYESIDELMSLANEASHDMFQKKSDNHPPKNPTITEV